MTTSQGDAVVVGGGAIGLACAGELAEAGASVVLIDRQRLGRGASYGNAGHFTPSDCVPLAAPGVLADALRWLVRKDAPLCIGTQFGLAEWKWLTRFAVACNSPSLARRITALAELGRLSAASLSDKLAAEVKRTGVLEVYETPKAFQSGREHAALLDSYGVSARVLSGGEVRRKESVLGSHVVGAVEFPDDGVFDPKRFVDALAARASAAGVETLEGTHVTQIVAENTRVRGVVVDGEIKPADVVVIAAGAQSRALLRTAGCDLPVISGRGYSLDVPTEVEPDAGLLFAERRIGVTPMGGRVRFAGMMDLVRDDGIAGRATQRRIAELDRSRREVMPHLAADGASTEWFGMRPCTPDGVPAIGALPVSGLYAATGHAMLGMTLALGTGHLIGDAVLGRTPAVDPRPYAPGRRYL